MKTLLIILLFILTTSFLSFAQSDEVTLFSSKGTPTAYIDTEDGTIYMWSGKPVAYIYKSNSDIHVYGFNGNHLGWFSSGIIYDHEGDIVGFIEDAINMTTEYEPFKSYKEYKPFKSYREYAPYKPYFSRSFSQTPLSIFLFGGINEN